MYMYNYYSGTGTLLECRLHTVHMIPILITLHSSCTHACMYKVKEKADLVLIFKFSLKPIC